MPLGRRYYIADLPGLAVLGDFHALSMVHMLAAVAFTCLVALAWTSRTRLSGGPLRAGLLALLVTTGLAQAWLMAMPGSLGQTGTA